MVMGLMSATHDQLMSLLPTGCLRSVATGSCTYTDSEFEVLLPEDVAVLYPCNGVSDLEGTSARSQIIFSCSENGVGSHIAPTPVIAFFLSFGDKHCKHKHAYTSLLYMYMHECARFSNRANQS